MPRHIFPILMLLMLLSGCGPTNTSAQNQTASPTPTPTPTAAANPNKDWLRRRDAALERAAQGPNDPAALRDALDQVILGIVDAPLGPTRIELAALHDQLVTQLQTALADAPVAAPIVATSAAVVTAPRPPSVVTRPQPAAPTPGTTFGVAERRSFEGSGAADSFNSCIDIQVIGRNGPLAGAVIGINNGDLSYQNQTDGNGYSGRCGLGPSTWSVVLFWTPAGGEVHNATTTVYLNGAAEQRAAIVFQEK
ncbi:MAG: hypothetical protein HC822_00395 [Oscillochloris sp.]|nr:hypothetical protein [Oscillochloris sp.]